MNDLNLSSDNFPMERYEPIKLLGKGALGEVFLARDRSLNRTVAVKRLMMVTDEQVVAFHREAKIASKLTHEHVIGILDFGTTPGGRPYMALEFFDGVSLEQYIEDQGRIPEDLAVEIFLTVARALSYIHKQNVFHRDLKPSNMLVKIDNSDSVDLRIIDFGLSSIKEELQTKTIMQGRTIVGTPLYMSPDQVSGLSYDARSEVYSLGCIMFEALTGHPPFNGDTPMEILDQHSNMLPPLLEDLMPKQDFTPGMQEIVEKCLSKSRGDRYQSMTELISALEQRHSVVAAEGTDIKVVNPSRRLKKWPIIAMSAVVLSSLVCLSVSMMNNKTPVQKPPKPANPKALSISKMLNTETPDVTDFNLLNKQTRDPDLTGMYFWGEESASRLKLLADRGQQKEAVSLRGLEVSNTEAGYIVKLQPTQLHFYSCKFKDPAVFETLSQCRLLVKLGFHNCTDIGDSDLRWLDFPKLKTLMLIRCGITDEHLKSLASLDSLSELVLDGNHLITFDGICSLGRPSKRSHDVEVLVDEGPLTQLSAEKLDELRNEYKLNISHPRHTSPTAR